MTRPGFRKLWNQLREYDIFELRKIYLAALGIIMMLNEYGYLPDQPDLAMDLTNLMWYDCHLTGKDDDGKRLDRDDIPHEDQPIGVEGVDQRTGSSFPLQIASISLTNVEMPVTLAAKSIQRRGSIEHHINEMLTYAVENDRPVKDDQGRHPFTANQFMIAMLLDMWDIDAGEARDISARNNIVREVFGDDYPFLLDGHPEFEN